MCKNKKKRLKRGEQTHTANGQDSSDDRRMIKRCTIHFLPGRGPHE